MKNINPGGIQDTHDSRDLKWQQLGGSSVFDWNKGYDIEKELGITLRSKNQGDTSSCGGQAMSYYHAILRVARGEDYSERSAKFCYAQVFFPNGGGSTGRSLCDLLIGKGISKEYLCPSYDDGQIPSEYFMRRIEDITQFARSDAFTAHGEAYGNVDPDIDLYANAIQANKGVIIGLYGENNGTWYSSFPKPPKNKSWGHWIYAGKAKLIDGKKHIGVKNSFGDTAGENGWQWISEEYFKSGMVWIGWTIVLPKIKFAFLKDLSLGIDDSDVLRLQKILNKYPSTQIAMIGPGSPGMETSYFGPKTLFAVQKYQKLNNILPLSGYVGPRTRAILNKG